MAKVSKTPRLSHVGSDGSARMVDVSKKQITAREATASAIVRMSASLLESLLSGSLPKGDVIAAARLAGIMGAKRTGNLIPLCHPMGLDWVDVAVQADGTEALRISCTARTTARTGVEMEAMTGAAIAALTVYDMVKSAEKGVTIGPIQLERKSGGKSGNYQRR